MESSLVIELKIALADTGYFVGLTSAGNSQFNLGRSWVEFKLELTHGTSFKTWDKSFVVMLKLALL